MENFYGASSVALKRDFFFLPRPAMTYVAAEAVCAGLFGCSLVTFSINNRALNGRLRS